MDTDCPHALLREQEKLPEVAQPVNDTPVLRKLRTGNGGRMGFLGPK